VGGYVPSNLGVDSLVVVFYRHNDLIYAARVRAGLVPATRREVFERLKHLRTPKCPFVNLPEPVADPEGPTLIFYAALQHGIHSIFYSCRASAAHKLSPY
jgi:bifunctional non-homologous end joining protein LigD